jgi:tetratricopeptide (TPR) repeat protein
MKGKSGPRTIVIRWDRSIECIDMSAETMTAPLDGETLVQESKLRRHVRIAVILACALSSFAAQEAQVQSTSPRAGPASEPVAARPLPATVERMLVEAVRETPASFAANHNLGEFYLHQGRLNAGIPYLRKAQQIDAHHYDNGYDLVLAYLEVGQAHAARSLIQEMLGRRETAELHNLLGDAQDKLVEYIVAANEYHRASELEPSEQNIFDLADFLLRRQKYAGFLKRSLEFFQFGVHKYPHSAQLTVGLGVALYADQQYDAAVQTLCAAVDLNPTDRKPFLFLGQVGRVSPRLLPEVRKRLEEFIRLYPRNAAANYYYALNLWQRTGGEPAVDLARIEQLLKTAVLLDPHFYEAHFQLGVLYQDQRRNKDAIAEFKRTVLLRPDFTKAHYRLFLLYSHVDEKKLAQQQLEVLRRLKKQDNVELGGESQQGEINKP